MAAVLSLLLEEIKGHFARTEDSSWRRSSMQDNNCHENGNILVVNRLVEPKAHTLCDVTTVHNESKNYCNYRIRCI